MEPSQVRARIMHDHESLREHLNELETACLALPTDRTKLVLVRELARRVLRELVQHTELEDAILAPALLDIDAWGPVRANQLLAHHQSQRDRIQSLIELYSTPLDTVMITRVTNSFIAELRTDMDHEDRDLLHPDLLRDDVTAVAGNSG